MSRSAIELLNENKEKSAVISKEKSVKKEFVDEYIKQCKEFNTKSKDGVIAKFESRPYNGGTFESIVIRKYSDKPAIKYNTDNKAWEEIRYNGKPIHASEVISKILVKDKSGNYLKVDVEAAFKDGMKVHQEITEKRDAYIKEQCEKYPMLKALNDVIKPFGLYSYIKEVDAKDKEQEQFKSERVHKLVVRDKEYPDSQNYVYNRIIGGTSYKEENLNLAIDDVFARFTEDPQSLKIESRIDSDK